ncbi:MAG TPA: YfiR family protein [Candidatus Sulfotelmatobacter sp.]|nr:YfiR family protein [Candidatus Sulfotelmatobacter sp.]
MRRFGISFKQRMMADRAAALRPALKTAALLLCFSFHPLHSTAQQAHPTESQVKAAYLYNFGKFVRWQSPPSGSDSFDICVLGKNPFGSALASTVAGEKLDGKNIRVRNVFSLPDATHCRILFISSSEENRLKPIVAVAKQSNLLTVSDIPGFAQRGGMIELVHLEDKIRFQVNAGAISDAGLTVSSELLKVAVKVIGTNQAREIAK